MSEYLVEVEGEKTEGRPAVQPAPVQTTKEQPAPVQTTKEQPAPVQTTKEQPVLNEGPTAPQKDTSQVLDEENRQLLTD